MNGCNRIFTKPHKLRLYIKERKSPTLGLTHKGKKTASQSAYCHRCIISQLQHIKALQTNTVN